MALLSLSGENMKHVLLPQLGIAISVAWQQHF
jgi:hypothetical protein